MGRLIDADELIKEYPQASGLKLIIENAPTAYDVDKVVENIQKRHLEMEDCLEMEDSCESQEYYDALEIAFRESITEVRKGGVE